MRQFYSFFKSKTGGIVLLALVMGVGFYFLKNHREREAVARVVAEEKEGVVNRERLGVLAPETEGIEPGEQTRVETIKDGKLHRFTPRKPEKPYERPDPILVRATEKNAKQADQKIVLPSLIHLEGGGARPELVLNEPTLFAPSGLLIKASLVLTVESGNFSTPVLGIITDDVYWEQKLIVPAGTWVHAFAQSGRQRDRIEVSGNWTFVWQDGREYVIQGLALNHEFDEEAGYSITDGSAGIRGQVLKSDKHQELKFMAATALAGAARASEETFQSVFGNTPDNSLSNAGLDGASRAADEYAKLLLEKLKEEGYYVRVPAGTLFYIYTQQTFEPELASVAGLKQGGKAVGGFDLSRLQHRQVAQSHEGQLRSLQGRGEEQTEAQRVQSLLENKERHMRQISEFLEENDPVFREAREVLVEEAKDGTPTPLSK